MSHVFRILVSALARGLVLGGIAVTAAGCGQKGNLYLPTDPAAANRSTLVEALRPGGLPAPAVPAQPVTPATPATPLNSAAPVLPEVAVEPALPASAPR
jgi:predicted small lipoprotein YifL